MPFDLDREVGVTLDVTVGKLVAKNEVAEEMSLLGVVDTMVAVLLVV